MHKLAVKVEGLEKRRRNVPILHYAAGFILLAKTLDYVHKFRFENIALAVPFFALALLSLLYGFRMKKWDAAGRFNPWLRLLQAGFFAILGVLFLRLDGVVDEIIVFTYGAICAYLYGTEKKAFAEAFVELNKEGVVLPGELKGQRLPWHTVENVVARPDFITIFKEKNHYLQLELLHNEAAEKLETINAFARRQLQLKK